jgi:YD repeat-containing protein
VTLTQPNGRRVTFYFTPQSYGGVLGFFLKPSYTPEAGTYGTLTANGCPLVVQSGRGYLCFLSTPQYAPTTYTYTDPYGTQFVMGSDGALKTITDLNSNTLTFSRDGITSSAGGREVRFVRDSQDRITQVIDPDDNVYAYGYDAAGDLSTVTLPGIADPVQYRYAAGHRITTIIDARGNQAAQASYDADGRLASETDAVGNTTGYAYDRATGTTTVTNPDGGHEVYAYDEQTYPQGTTPRVAVNMTNATLDVRVHPQTGQVERRTTRYGYDALHRQIAQGSTTYQYNGDGVLVCENGTAYTQDLAAPLSQILHDSSASYVYRHERLCAVGGD